MIIMSFTLQFHYIDYKKKALMFGIQKSSNFKWGWFYVQSIKDSFAGCVQHTGNTHLQSTTWYFSCEATKKKQFFSIIKTWLFKVISFLKVIHCFFLFIILYKCLIKIYIYKSFFILVSVYFCLLYHSYLITQATHNFCFWQSSCVNAPHCWQITIALSEQWQLCSEFPADEAELEFEFSPVTAKFCRFGSVLASL